MKLFHIALIFVVCLSVSSAFSYRRRRPSRPTQEDPKKLEESLWWMTKGNDNGKDNGDVGTNQRSDDDDDVDIADDSNINNNNDQDQDTDVGRNNNGRNKDQKKERQDRRNERRNDKKNARQDRRNDRQDGRQDKRNDRQNDRQDRRNDRQNERQDKRNDRQNERQERRIDRKNDRQSSRNDRQNNRRDKSSGGNNRYGNGGTGGRNNNGGTNNNNGGTNNNNGNNGRTPPTETGPTTPEPVDVCEEKSNEGSCGFYTHPQCFQRVLNTCRPLPVLAEKICTQSELRESEFNDEGLRYIQKVRQCTIKKLLPVVDSDDCDRVNSLVQSGLTQTPGCLFQNKDFCSVVSDPGNCEALFHIFGLGHAGELQFELFQTFNILIGQCDTETQDIFNVNFSQKFLASQTEATTTTTPPTMMMMGGNGRD